MLPEYQCFFRQCLTCTVLYFLKCLSQRQIPKGHLHETVVSMAVFILRGPQTLLSWHFMFCYVLWKSAATDCDTRPDTFELIRKRKWKLGADGIRFTSYLVGRTCASKVVQVPKLTWSPGCLSYWYRVWSGFGLHLGTEPKFNMRSSLRFFYILVCWAFWRASRVYKKCKIEWY